MLKFLFRKAYEQGMAEGRAECWREVNKWIKQGPLEFEQRAQRNGMILAANLIMELICRK